MIEKWRAWSDSGGDLDNYVGTDFLLTLCTIYWATNSITSSMRDYYDSRWYGAPLASTDYVTTPTAVSVFAHHFVSEGEPPREWYERLYNITQWTVAPRGGHFAAIEAPDSSCRAYSQSLWWLICRLRLWNACEVSQIGMSGAVAKLASVFLPPDEAVSVRAVVEAANDLWPVEGAHEWDAVGLVCGEHAAAVSRILLCVDVVSATVTEAIGAKADLVLAHHPLLLRGVTSVADHDYKGALLTSLIRSKIALLTAHTNADIVWDGVSDVFAARLGLSETTPIVAQGGSSVGVGRVGKLPEPMTLGEFASSVAATIPATVGDVRVAGDPHRVVSRVAVCGGAGDSLLRERAVQTADVYVTSDLRHHPASEARENAMHGGGPALIDVSHWASESLWLEVAAAQLRTRFPQIDVRVSTLRTDPWDFVVSQNGALS